MNLSMKTEVITADQLIEDLANCLFNNFVPRLKSSANSETDQNPDELSIEQNINDALSIFGNLQFGLDINLKFSGVGDFEYTRELEIFDVFRINLYHGWLIDPQQTQLYDNLKNKSYNQLVEMSLESPDSNPNEEKEFKRLLAQNFLEQTASQLTYYGLSELHASLAPDELCILFRNNHFSTLYKHPRSGELFILVTDNGYLMHGDIVWETLDNIEGDGTFCNSNFRPINSENQVSQKESNNNPNDSNDSE